MEETPWLRLRRLIDERRLHLGLTLTQIDANGGPSPKWVQSLTVQTGEPTARMRRSMRHLDGALGWEPDTAWQIAAGELTEPVEAPDEVAEFTARVVAHLRGLPMEERERAMDLVLTTLDKDPRTPD